ncbi:2-amino-4-hydroxy-6-hydroxymethyldihydropteridine diphosphokinase [Roseivirga misakiensis]|uniref:2-amino-4-hydroxy-6-hydroxymethyldihydropteridine pyrophosphokinase n=1 Tax=Roseivirga misakiensis TaxID=1563681 RepID=A0A1E5T4D6_9BACT|nr:2-amino-4-hydroxy-6-hydroxymethyldihydropteridine diphosphokinase [Roseivirga misakiensis]OEK06216.1 2-amino-4-hydroxy-6-hydroxymethyldihydropteridine diphosphokinase [Roseivirga misakiensis]
MNSIYLLLGSNLGDRLANLRRVCELLIVERIAIRKESSIYETAAWGVEDQPTFLNQVVEIETSRTPERLLALTQAIELEMGRKRVTKWGERLIDIDILYCEEVILNKPELIIPHPEIQNRRFTLVPMVEIAPDFEHPVLKVNQQKLLDNCPDELEVLPFSIDY